MNTKCLRFSLFAWIMGIVGIFIITACSPAALQEQATEAMAPSPSPPAMPTLAPTLDATLIPTWQVDDAADEAPQPQCAFAWAFDHFLLDSAPLASYRINDIQIGDINGDGLPDVWTSGRGSGETAYQMVWYRSPDWTRFEIAQGDYKYGNLGDIDGDGDLDIVVSSSWFENVGTPETRDWPEHPLGYDFEPDLFHLGDINQDGRLDIVLTTKEKLFWLQNSGDPREDWEMVQIAEDRDRRTGGAIADLDGDGDLDVLWGNAWYENPADPAAAPWPMHMIDGGWPAEARGVVADLNGDGHPDVVLSGEESGVGVAWYQAPAHPQTGLWLRHDVLSQGYEGLHSLALSDFDTDGDLDIFIAEMHHGENPDKVAIFENADSTATRWVEHLVALTGSHNAKVGDLNGDGCPDIVGKNYQAGELPLQVDVWLSRATAPTSPTALPLDRWQRHIIDAQRPWRAVFITSGDINGDSLPDIITGGWWYANPGSPAGSWQRHAIGGKLNNMAVVHDLDGDGDLDILGTKGKVESDKFLWAENDGRGEFTIHGDIPRAEGDFLQGARAGQVIPGGNPEVILSWHNATSTQIYQIPEPATGEWAWGEVNPVTTGEQIALGDIDRDGDVDIHLGTVWLRTEGGGWTVVEAFTMGTPDADPDRVELADIDGDGDLDVVVGAEHARSLVWAESPGLPDSPWLEHTISNDILAMSLDVGDMDADGDVDIVVGEHDPDNANNGRVLIYQNDGDGMSWQIYQVDSGLEHHDGTQLVDIDNDGDLDIISIGWTHDQVILYENLAIDE